MTKKQRAAALGLLRGEYRRIAQSGKHRDFARRGVLREVARELAGAKPAPMEVHHAAQ